MRRVDDIGRSSFYCSCGGSFGYTVYTIRYLRDWLIEHRKHDTSPMELEVTRDLQTQMGWTDEQIREDVATYTETALRYIQKGETTNASKDQTKA